MGASDIFAVSLVAAEGLLIAVGIVFLLSGLDDLFIDLCYTARTLYRRVLVLPKHQPLTEEHLLSRPEQAIAVMIPAWDESAVIRRMLENTLRTLNYENYRVFVGTYPNDVATQREVEKVREQFGKVERIVCPHDGPTNKADCLNWIYLGIKLYEKRNDTLFEAFVMQDCEDIIHPLCYKLLNHLIPRKDMVQLPVLSLETKWHNFTGGHYIDEFAQLHYKDILVREFLDRSIPAAGVGCAFSRRALDLVAAGHQNELFSTDSLTEDYDFGLRLKRYGLKQIFARFFVTRIVTRRNRWTGRREHVTVRDLVCVREYFPAKFSASVRQKSRWVVGITLQGWEHLGWKGGARTRYMLFRDRKSLVTNLVNILGYLVVPLVVGLWIANRIDPESYRFPPLLEQGSWLWYVLLANGILLVVRILQRAYCTQRLYGWTQALLSLPRMVWGNAINFLATCRAIRLYLRYLRSGKLIAWDKTSHTYPSEEELLAYRRRLGEVLLARRLVTVDQLNEALRRQQAQPRRLGEILSEMGVVGETELQLALAGQ